MFVLCGEGAAQVYLFPGRGNEACKISEVLRGLCIQESRS